jgi:hypothetical protein
MAVMRLMSAVAIRVAIARKQTLLATTPEVVVAPKASSPDLGKPYL